MTKYVIRKDKTVTNLAKINKAQTFTNVHLSENRQKTMFRYIYRTEKMFFIKLSVSLLKTTRPFYKPHNCLCLIQNVFECMISRLSFDKE